MEKYQIVKKSRVAQNVCEYTIYAPMVSRHCRAGQFVILRTDADGERVPFTICDYSRKDGTVSLLIQEVGFTTMKLAQMNEGDVLADVAGPLGNPTDLSRYNRVLLIAGGIGAAVVYPQLKQLKADGKRCDVISGARNVGLLMYAEQMKSLCDNFYPVTDDGSSGEKGFVTTVLERLLVKGERYDAVFAVGPLGMMRAVCAVTETYEIPTIVSMNSIMVDGTGMCGCCRLTVDGKIKYACIHGPEFDGHKVDFDEAIARSKVYKEQEAEHICRLRSLSGRE